MKLVCRYIARLPKLAWGLTHDRNGTSVEVLHGAWVEARERAFVEGVWDGDFGDLDFGQTNGFFGSGGIVDKGGLTLVSTAATTDYIHWSQRGDRLLASNSLPLLLAMLDDNLDPRCPDYVDIDHSIKHGVDRYRREIPTVRGTVQRLMYFNLRIDPDGTREVDKTWPPRFEKFEDYRQYLKQKCQAILSNARSAQRARPLKVLSTQSRGYDTTAVNAIASQFGIDCVFAIPEGQGDRFSEYDKDIEQDDNGIPVCEALSLKNQVVRRREFEHAGDEEYFYYSTISRSLDLNYMGIANQVMEPSILLGGALGENTWRQEPYRRYFGGTDAMCALEKSDLGGNGLTEVRLEHGFIPVNPLFLAARRRDCVQSIGESDEMRGWCLGGDYDRPLSRRIAEEAGVPRHLFGQKKAASAVILSYPQVPINPKLRAEYFVWLQEHGLAGRWYKTCFRLVHRINEIIHFSTPYRHRFIYYFERLVTRLVQRKWKSPILLRRLDGTLFCFALAKRRAVYVEALRAEMHTECCDKPAVRSIRDGTSYE